MSQLSEDPVRTFTVGFEDDRYDESDMARSVAEYHDTDHTEYVVSSDDVRDVIPSVLGQLGEPFADPSLIPTYVVARETSQDVKVALSGDGADELFAGYNRYRGEYYSQLYRSLPNPIRSMVIEPAVNRLPASRESRVGELFRKAQVFVDAGVDDIRQRHFQWVRKNSDNTDPAYVNCDPTAAGSSVIDREHDRITEWLPKERRGDLDRIMAVDTYHGLSNQMLRKVDLASM
jgi:asparagine synthase (glutamine-hydrolysing)